MIDKLNERITVQKCDVDVDDVGNHISVWTDYFSCDAYAGTYTRDETENAVPAEQRTVVFEVRYCSELAGVSSTGYRVLFHGIPYDIESIDMMNYNRKAIRLSCRKEARA